MNETQPVFQPAYLASDLAAERQRWLDQRAIGRATR